MNRLSATSLLCAAAFTLAACGGGPDFAAGGRKLPTPDDTGIYVLTPDDELARIDGSPEWERQTWPARADFTPGIEFVLYEPALAGGDGDAVHLWRVAWLRSELQPTGQAAPVSGSQWVAAELEGLRVPLAVTPHPEIPGLFHLDPGARLEPGLYELKVSPRGVERRQGRFGVLWNSVDKRTYSAAHCVDRVNGGRVAFRPCAASQANVAQAGAGQTAYNVFATTNNAARNPLRIELLDPVRERGGLRIRGTVSNSSNRAQAIPEMRATVFDRAGRRVDSWVFAPPQGRIAPGGQVMFTAWQPVAEGAARLDVDFVRTDQRTGS